MSSWATDDFGWGPNNQFKFPLVRRHGRILSPIRQAAGGHVNLNKGVDFINLSKKEVRFTDGEIAEVRSSHQRHAAGQTLQRCHQRRNAARDQKGDRVACATAADTWSASASSSRARAPNRGCISPKTTARSIASRICRNYSPYMTPDNDTLLLAAVRNQLQRIQAGRWQARSSKRRSAA